MVQFALDLIDRDQQIQSKKESEMSAFDTARKFFEACEAPGGWAACSGYVEDDAPFSCQAAPLTEIRSDTPPASVNLTPLLTRFSVTC